MVYDTVEYTYDTRGNILSKTYALGETVVADNEYVYTDSTWKDRLTEYNDVEIKYDTIGNPDKWVDGSALAWQKGRQLASYTKDGVKTTFTYDDEGIRRSKTTNGVKTEYNVYDGTLRSITSGSNTMRFVYGNGLSSVIFNDTEYWYVYNAQGDVIGLIDAGGSYVVQYTYDAWGKILSQTDSDLAHLNPFRYRGYIYDEETGLYYLQSRYYDPSVGRFINADGQISDVGGDIRGYNQFAYCFNAPVSMDDATGDWPSWNDVINVAKNAVNIIVDIAVKRVIGTSRVNLLKTLHYSRNLLNNNNYTEQELKDKGYKAAEEKSARFHQNDLVNDEPNKKYVIGDWLSSEIVYYSDGTINDTPEDMGTPNVYSGDNKFLNNTIHVTFDVTPYILWGNCPEDSTTFVDRVIMIWG